MEYKFYFCVSIMCLFGNINLNDNIYTTLKHLHNS